MLRFGVLDLVAIPVPCLSVLSVYWMVRLVAELLCSVPEFPNLFPLLSEAAVVPSVSERDILCHGHMVVLDFLDDAVYLVESAVELWPLRTSYSIEIHLIFSRREPEIDGGRWHKS